MDFREIALLLVLSVPGVFRGFYRSGFEISDFVFCEGSLTVASFLGAVDAPRAHVVLESIAPAAERKLQRPTGSDASEVLAKYVEWHGVLRAPQNAMGWSYTSFGLSVDSVIDVREPRAMDCPVANAVSGNVGAPFDTVAVLTTAWATIRRNIPVNSERNPPRDPVKLQLSSRVTLETVPVAAATIDRLRRRRLPIVPQRFVIGASTQYALLELRSLRDGRQRAIFAAQWFTPINAQRYGIGQRRTDTALVTCTVSGCTGNRPNAAR